MSTENLYEYIKGEFKAINRVKQQPVADDADTWFRDENQVKLAGYNIEIWSAVTAGTQLTLGTDYVLALRDEAISGNEGFDVYAGYSIINAIYQGVDLYLTANIVGGYTSRPYRPTFSTVTANTTFIPSSMDDSIIADSTAGGFTITLGTPEYDNQRVAVICSGDSLIEIAGPGLEAESYSNLALQYVGIGGIWLQLGGAGGGGGGNLAVGQVTWVGYTGTLPADKLPTLNDTYLIADYPALFAKIGNAFGGDGITTFATPLINDPLDGNTKQWCIQAFDTVQEVPGDPSLIPAWVEEYNNPTPQTIIVEYVDNDWGGGLFYFGVSYIFLTEEVRTNGIMAVEIDGIDRTATLNVTGSSSVIVKYYGATNEFRAFALGTDFTSVSMVAIYKWDNVASGTLNPPVDGWELVFEGSESAVPNTFGLGQYRIERYRSATLNQTVSFTVRDLAVNAAEAGGSAVMYDASTGDFVTDNVLYPIEQIWKFNGLLNVIHTDANGIIQDEEINGQWVTRWAGGRMEITDSNTFTDPINQVADNHFYDIPSTIAWAVPFVTPLHMDVYAYDTAFYTAQAYSFTTTGYRVVITRDVSNETPTVYVSVNAVGRWK